MRPFIIIIGLVVSDLRDRFVRAAARPVVLADKFLHVTRAPLALALELIIGIVFTGLKKVQVAGMLSALLG